MIIQANSSARPEIGAVLTRPKGIVSHSGIYLGQDHVFENVPEGARIVPWSQFAAGHPVTVGTKLKIHAQELWQRAQAIVVERRAYHLTDFNCDDAVNEVAGEIVRQSQVLGFALAGIAVFAVASLLSSNS